MKVQSIKFNTREPIGSSTYPMPEQNITECFSLVKSNFMTPPVKTEELTSIYIHIPFCDQICSFCGFNKFISTEDTKEGYVLALIKEMEYYSKLPHVQGMKIGSAYIGGGTPNTLSANQLDRVLANLIKLFDFTKDSQITLEGTPQRYTDDLIAVLKKHGVSRVSAGVQTFDTNIRKEHLNMLYPQDQLIKFVENISANFDNFNLDMIYNLPGQTSAIWKEDLSIALSLKSTHLTIYPLVLLEKTAFYSKYIKQKKIDIPNQEDELEQFNITLDILGKTNFKPHTIRDWSVDNQYCKYIDLNAKCNQVLAFGAGAHGYVAGITYRNERNLAKYINANDTIGTPLELCKVSTLEERMQRFMVMGLRLFELDMSEFQKRFGINWKTIFGSKVDALVKSGYINLNGNIITHTDKGHIWANNVRTYFEGKKGTSVGYTDSIGVDNSGKSHYEQISRVKASADIEAHT